MFANYDYYSKIRDALKLNDSKVSAMSGVSKATISDWRTGKSKPKIDKIQKIAAILGCTENDLMQEEPGEKPIVREPNSAYMLYIDPTGESNRIHDILVDVDSDDRFIERMTLYSRILSLKDKETLIDLASIMHEKTARDNYERKAI